MTTYNHAFAICFATPGSTDKDGEDVTAGQLREAILLRVMKLSDAELLEAVGAPTDTYEEDHE